MTQAAQAEGDSGQYSFEHLTALLSFLPEGLGESSDNLIGVDDRAEGEAPALVDTGDNISFGLQDISGRPGIQQERIGAWIEEQANPPTPPGEVAPNASYGGTSTAAFDLASPLLESLGPLQVEPTTYGSIVPTTSATAQQPAGLVGSFVTSNEECCEMGLSTIWYGRHHVCPIFGAHHHHADGSVTFRTLADFRFSHVQLIATDMSAIDSGLRGVDLAITQQAVRSSESALSALTQQVSPGTGVFDQKLVPTATETGSPSYIVTPAVGVVDFGAPGLASGPSAGSEFFNATYVDPGLTSMDWTSSKT